MNNKENVLKEISQKKREGKQIVFTNGCFDLLHIGHIRYLTQAKALGDILIVGLNSDSSIKALKGENRPIISQAERKEMLLALKAVDFVEFFNEDNPLNLIKEIKPDILVKGGDWSVEQIIGSDFVNSYGGKTLSLQLVEGFSTSNIIDKVLKSKN